MTTAAKIKKSKSKDTAGLPVVVSPSKLKKLEEYIESKPYQLTLFEILNKDDQKYSNTIELYDGAPKFFWGKVERVSDKYLDPIHRDFVHKGKKYAIKISPGNLTGKDGVSRYYYPAKREEIVEDALRKLAVEGQGKFLNDAASVQFTLYQLREELKKEWT